MSNETERVGQSDSEQQSVNHATVVLEGANNINAETVRLGENWTEIVYITDMGQEMVEHIPNERVKKVESGEAHEPW